ncbi:hypothetical protein X742_32815 [Mesorhizobium sp. LNHC232B00]|nr:hypothetical protein X742_32815 [Mesorhizobium sp. LNHC232B00]
MQPGGVLKLLGDGKARHSVFLGSMMAETSEEGGAG